MRIVVAILGVVALFVIMIIMGESERIVVHVPPAQHKPPIKPPKQ